MIENFSHNPCVHKKFEFEFFLQVSKKFEFGFANQIDYIQLVEFLMRKLN